MEKMENQTSEVAELLHNMPIFKEADAEDINILAEQGKIITLPAGTTVFEQNTDQQIAYAILEGSVSVIKDDIKMGHRKAGQIVGELCMLDGTVYSASAVAETDVEMFTISRESFLQRLHHSGTFSAAIIHFLCRKLKRYW